MIDASMSGKTRVILMDTSQREVMSCYFEFVEKLKRIAGARFEHTEYLNSDHYPEGLYVWVDHAAGADDDETHSLEAHRKYSIQKAD
jgi:hypothetical protein